MFHRGDAHRAGWLVTQRADGRNLALDLVEPRPDPVEEALARLSQETLRVVRVSSRMPSRASRVRTV